MTPRFYGFLWMIFSLVAGVLWLSNVSTMLTLVVVGFITFGLIFVGMMCVLPGVVAHPPTKREKLKFFRNIAPSAQPVPLPTSHMRYPVGLRHH